MSVRYGLLTLLRDHGPQSRAQLTGRLQVPRPRLLAELDRLVASGTVVEAGPNASRGRRRSPLVELNPDLRLAAIDLDARSVGVEVTDGRLQAVAAHTEHCDIRTGPVTVLGRVTQILDKIRAEGHFTRLDAIGIGLPGPVSFREGIPVSPPIMPGWDRHPVRDVLSDEHGCPVAVDNDVNVMTLGEQHSGVARTVDNLIFVKIGSGIGCGVQIEGRIYRGAAGCAGDIGHIQVDADGPVCSCGNVGCLEALFSHEALARHAESAADGDRSPVLAERLAARGSLTARDVADGA
ncbi:ROK family protein, partial [Streptomyces carpinensis]